MSEVNFPYILETTYDLTDDQISTLMHSANRLKEGFSPLGKNQLGGGLRPIVATCFFENSTRTLNSFAISAQRIGAIYIDVNPHFSSLKKGEDLEETLHTLKAQGVDLCILRSSIPKILGPLKKDPPLKIINGGDGDHHHPTQALLDYFTLQEEGIQVEGKTMGLVGDIVHSRVANSLVDVITRFGGKVLICSPKELQSHKFQSSQVELTNSLEEAAKKADYLYLLRVQKERHENLNLDFNQYSQDYGVTLQKLEDWNREIPVLHPGPANIGEEIDRNLIESSLYFGRKQVKNSMFLRMALIKTMLKN
jgi:aspartate carbamoyltransferase catalytic subunit